MDATAEVEVLHARPEQHYLLTLDNGTQFVGKLVDFRQDKFFHVGCSPSLTFSPSLLTFVRDFMLIAHSDSESTLAKKFSNRALIGNW
ncbi:hypothetical protein DL93DRAFT_464499 [Clavulina sp. PMI_390]|nr:hypothetical protein DL93DRAFT_464499 [Clavulina sp. PMI_390]